LDFDKDEEDVGEALLVVEPEPEPKPETVVLEWRGTVSG
jgi:hypothetical protein